MINITQHYAMEAFDGIMLSDGGLKCPGRNAYFEMSLSGKHLGLLEYLEHVRDILEVLGVKACNTHPKAFETSYRGKPFTYYRLNSLCSSFLTFQYGRWYSGNGSGHRTKGVPADFCLTHVCLAYEYMGDGGSQRDSRAYHFRTVSAHLSTHGFSILEVEILEEQLHALGLNTGRSINRNVVKGSGIRITILQDSVDKFMSIVEPFIHKAYKYKVKYKNNPEELVPTW